MKRSNLAVALVAAALVAFVVKESWAGHPVDGTAILNLLVFALPLAGVYAISAAGLVVVYTTTGIFNFAQGAIGMFMAYLYWELRVQPQRADGHRADPRRARRGAAARHRPRPVHHAPPRRPSRSSCSSWSPSA